MIAGVWWVLTARPATAIYPPPEFVGALCTQAGLHVEYHREVQEGSDQCNVIARPQAPMPPEELLLQSHLDTVEPGHFSQWTMTQSNPYNASIYNDLMYGLGTADAKLDFLCKLEAIKEFQGKTLKLPFVLVGTFGAQRGMTGAIKLIRRKKLNARKAFVGEPTQMQLVTAGQGLAVVEISVPFSDEERAYRRDHDLTESSSTQSRMFSGKAAHSSDPLSGDNAISKMLTYLAQLPEGIALMDLDGGINHNSVPASAILEIDTVGGFQDPILPKIVQIASSLHLIEKELQDFREEGFAPPTMNLGMIRTSEAEVRITGSCRFPPAVTDAIYEQWMKKLNAAVQAVGATFRVKDYRKGFTTPAASAFVQGAQVLLGEMNLSPALHKISMATEASVLSRLGIECVVWGPGQSVGNSHAPNESIKISDLKLAIEFYKRAIERFCL